MRISKKYLNNPLSGIVDPISLISLMFLMITLVVGTKFVNDRNTSLNIEEKARNMESERDVDVEPQTKLIDSTLEKEELEFMKKKITQPINKVVIPKIPDDEDEIVVTQTTSVKTCGAKGKQYPVGAVVVYLGEDSLATCGEDGLWKIDTEKKLNITDISSDFVPEYLKPTYNTAIEEKNKAEASQTIEVMPLQEQPAGQQTTTSPTIDTVTNTTTQPSKIHTTSTCSNECSYSQRCISIGYGYYGCQDISTLTTTIGTRQCNGSNLEEWTGEKWHAVYCKHGCSVNKCNSLQITQPIPTESVTKSDTLRDNYSNLALKDPNRIIQKFINANGNYEYSVAEKEILKQLCFSINKGPAMECTDLEKFSLNYVNKTSEQNNPTNLPISSPSDIATLSNYSRTVKYGVCESETDLYKKAKCNNNMVAIEAGFSNDLIPKLLGVGNYIQSYKEAVYDSDGYLDAYSDKEAISSSVKLGTNITATAAFIVPSSLPVATGGLFVKATAFGQKAMAISTVYQTGNTVSYCTANGMDETCEQMKARTEISWLTMGIGQYANVIKNTLGKIANTIVSGGNFLVDADDAHQAFFRNPNATDLDKAMSVVALFGDVFGGFGDFKQGQLGLSSYTGPRSGFLDISTDLANSLNSPATVKTVDISGSDLSKALNTSTTPEFTKEMLTPKVADVGGNVPKPVEITTKSVITWFEENIANPVRSLSEKPSDIKIDTTKPTADIPLVPETKKPLLTRLFGEPKTSSFSDVKMGEEIVLKPGDTIKTGLVETAIPNLKEYPDVVLWKVDGSTDAPRLLTADGIPVTNNKTTQTISFFDELGNPIKDKSGKYLSITLADELNVKTTITPLKPESGAIVTVFDQYITNPLRRTGDNIAEFWNRTFNNTPTGIDDFRKPVLEDVVPVEQIVPESKFVNNTILPVEDLLKKGEQGLPDLHWKEPDLIKTNIETSRISAIFSWNLQERGGGGFSIEDFRKLIREGNFDWQKANLDPITGYELPDGTIYIQSGRHKAIALIEEGVTNIPITLNRLSNSQLPVSIKMTDNTIKSPNLPDPDLLNSNNTTPFQSVKTFLTEKITTPITEFWNRNIINSPVGDLLFDRPVLENLDTPLKNLSNTENVYKFSDNGIFEVKSDGELKLISLKHNTEYIYREGITNPVTNITIIKDSGGNYYAIGHDTNLEVIKLTEDLGLLTTIKNKARGAFGSYFDEKALNQTIEQILHEKELTTSEVVKYLIENGYNPKSLNLSVLDKIKVSVAYDRIPSPVDNSILSRWTRPINDVNSPQADDMVSSQMISLENLENYAFDPSGITITGKTIVNGRLTLEIKFPNGETALMYRSSGLGASDLKKQGEWIVAPGFARDDWFIKNMSSLEMTQGGNSYLTSLAQYLQQITKTIQDN